MCRLNKSVGFINIDSCKKCIWLNAVCSLSSRERPAPSYLHWFSSHIRGDFQRAVITAGRQKCWPLDPLWWTSSIIQKQQQNRSSYDVCYYFSSHSVLNWSWWHLLKPSAGLQPYKSLNEVMSTRNDTFHLFP